jgi:hypothetical protein
MRSWKRPAKAPMSQRSNLRRRGRFDLASDDDELLAKDQVFGDQGCSGLGAFSARWYSITRA